MDIKTLNKLWGKTKEITLPNNETKTLYIPVIYHLINSGVVAQAILENYSPEMKERLANQTNFNLEDFKKYTGYRTATHDLGKPSPGFQAKRTEKKEELKQEGFSFSSIDEKYHNVVTAKVIGKYNTSNDEAVMLGGHHGIFPHGKELTKKVGCGDGLWEEARDVAIEILEKIFNPPKEKLIADHAFYLFFAGLISISDWISSNESFFPYQESDEEKTIEQYVEEAKIKAQEALIKINWINKKTATNKRNFNEIFPNYTPNSLQQLVIDMTKDVKEPQLLLIEAPMGIGKTEAALYFADLLDNTIGSNGMYVALPTQATANAMFSRFQEYLEHCKNRENFNLHLLHGMSSISPEYQTLKNINSDDSQVYAEEWFTATKRKIIAPFGVGTIDQALMSVLMTRYFFIGLFGLTNKVVIFDEVHAFDVYTSKILQRLIEWLSLMGCSVILLSATLPKSKKIELLKAYAGKEIENLEVPYPSVSSVSRNGEVKSNTFDTKENKNIEIHEIEEEDIIKYQEGCTAVFCNSVQKAQELYSSLKTKIDQDTELILIHARLTLDKRLEIEEKIIEKFGKGENKNISNPNRPKKAIVVTTQILEQSLDIDFDIMISFYAPIDLLFQRIGRLHRHAITERPSKLKDPKFLLIRPQLNSQGNPTFERSVYPKYILLKTWAALLDKLELNIPNDIENLIEYAYNIETKTPDFLDKDLKDSKKILDAQITNMENEAVKFLLPPSRKGYSFTSLMNRESGFEEDEDVVSQFCRASTRYSKYPSRKIIAFEKNDNGEICIRNNGQLEVFDLKKRLTKNDIEKLLKRSCSVVGYVWPFYFKDKTPEIWDKTLLGYYSIVIFDKNNPITTQTKYGPIYLYLDEELGIFEKKEEE